jgi:hypothetical protein
MDINMRENGFKVKKMDVVLKYFQMDIVIMECFTMIKLLDPHQNKFLFLPKNIEEKNQLNFLILWIYNLLKAN